jgi:peptidoglycan-associated lipoprotein
MKHQMRILQGLKLAAVLAVALSMGACANKNLGADGAMASAATPGSQQDFVVNVGDRVFFESDQTELTPQAIATLEKQAQWLQSYNRYSFTIEGHADERGTREYNIALGARRAQSVRTFSPRAASMPTGCARSPTARNARSRCVTTSPAGRRTAARHGAERQLLRQSSLARALEPAPSGAGFVLARR